MRRIFFAALVAALVLASTPAAALAQDATQPVIHIVQPEENLYRIALYYNVAVEAIMQANGLTDRDKVIVGQALVIPVTGAYVQPVAAVPDVVVDAPLVPDNLGAASAPETTADAPETVDPALAGEDLGILGANGGPAAAAGNTTDSPDDPEDSSPAASADSGDGPEAPDDLGIIGAESSPTGNSSTGDDEAGPTAPAGQTALSAGDPAFVPYDLGMLVSDPGLFPPDPSELANDWIYALGVVSTGGQNARAIFQHGQDLGNNPRAFSKIGDCNSEAPFFLAKFDKGEYDLGDYGYLQAVIDQFAGSYGRDSLAAWTGNHAWALFDPVWSNPTYCQAGESPLACEFRINRPSVVLIRLGTNEAGSTTLFEENLRKIIDFSIERGVIPILGTKADRLEGSDAHNELIRRLAAEYKVPLWDFGRVADRLPVGGLMPDGFHLTYAAPYYNYPAALQTGHAIQNLTALMILDAVWRAAMY